MKDLGGTSLCEGLSVNQGITQLNLSSKHFKKGMLKIYVQFFALFLFIFETENLFGHLFSSTMPPPLPNLSRKK